MGFGKNSRPGKRSSSSSSYLSTVTTVGFVALCLVGVWMLTSSSFIPSQTTTSTRTRFSKKEAITRDPPPAQDDEDGTSDLPSDDDDRKISSALGRKSGRPSDYRDENRQTSAESNVDDNPVDKDQMMEEDRVKGASVDEEGAQTQQPERKDAEEEEEESVENQLKESSHENREKSQEEKEESTEQQSQETEGNDDNQTNVESDENHQQQESAQNEERDESKQLSQRQADGEDDENQQQSEKETEGESNDGHNQEQSQLQQNEVESDEQNQDQSQQQQQKSEGENDENQQQFEQQGESENEQGSQQNVKEENNDENGSQSQQNDERDSVQESERIDDESAANQEVQQSSEKLTEQNASDSFPDGARSEISKEGKARKGFWSTQADQSQNEKERRQESSMYGYTWELCNVTAGPDYIPCLDNEKALKHVHTRHYEHRERHCPEETPSCLVPLPAGYKGSIEWPKSRDKIWYRNVPHTKLVTVKGHQNWVKVDGEYLTFPGGGTQFIHGALHYIDFIQQAVPKITWGKHTRVILDVGCGVASFGGYLFERDVIAMSFAPKDEHEAQVQFALERGIPAISAVMGSQRLPFPSRVFDIVHCARCRVPWHAEGGTLLLELNRVLRPGGYFVWSATPVYQKLKEDVEIWKEMRSLTSSMCWDLITIKKDKLNSVGAAIFRKPVSNECYKNRKKHSPPMCKEDDDSSAAWYVPLQACMHRVPVAKAERGSQWPKEWPLRLQVPPYWLNNTQVGVYGKHAPADFVADYEHWKRVVSKSYLSGLGISWSNVRNVMDMRAIYGGFAAALNDLKVWVMNVVNVDSPDTLPIIYERGLFGIYHDWCESFSTYPRTYDLLHADHLFSNLKKRCKIVPVMAEIDRIVRPGGKLIVRDESGVVGEVENLLKSLHWEVRLTFSKSQVAILSAQKSDWRPETLSAYS